VPNLWDNMADAPRTQSELNPLTNPTLERNLGRWAQVYFGNPPGKRERAVNALLEEIRRETSAGQPVRPSEEIRRETPGGQPVRPYFARGTQFQEVVCSTCQYKNTQHYKFCGRCGAALNAAPSGKNTTFETTPVAESGAQFARNVQWLRYRSLSNTGGAAGRGWRGWKYAVGGVVLALVGFAYLQWAPRTDTRMASSGAASSGAKIVPRASAPERPLPVENSSSEIRRPSETISPPTKPSEAPKTAAAGETHGPGAPPAGLQSAAQKSRLLDVALPSPALPSPVPPSPVNDAGESGVPDLRLAQRYLGGSMGVRDSSEAAKLLWKAVRRQNTSAAILLSDLYMRGDGVPRSCDQARLLLVAAAKRGAPQAAQQLRSLELRGCR
jgi:hypothetical protein